MQLKLLQMQIVDEVDPADLAPLVRGTAPIVTVPALEDGDVTKDKVEDKNVDDDAEDLVKVLQDVLDGLEEGGGAALRVLECSQGFGVAPRVLE